MEIIIIKKEQPIKREELGQMAKDLFGNLVKAVVDVEQRIMALGGEFHADGETMLMEEEGSQREHTWGINLYPENPGDEFIEFDSMVNLKPAFGNRSRGVDDEKIRDKIREIINTLIQK